MEYKDAMVGNSRGAELRALRTLKEAIRMGPQTNRSVGRPAGQHICASALLLIFIFTFAFACDVFGSIGAEELLTFGDTHIRKQEAKAVTTDALGNIIMAGYTTENGSEDFLVVKFNAAGGLAWRKVISAGGRIQAVVTDSDNNIIVTGYSWTTGYGYTNYDMRTIKLDTADSGNVLWDNSVTRSASSNDYGIAIAVDSSKRVYAGGYGQAANGKDDFIIVRYTTAGAVDTTFGSGNSFYNNGGVAKTTGMVIYNGASSGDDRITSIAVNDTAAANYQGVAATGYSWGGTSNFDCLTVKYSLTGVYKWEKRYTITGVSAEDRGTVVKMDSSGNVFAAGYTTNSSSNRDMHLSKLEGSTGSDSVNGWMKTFDGGYDDEPRDIWIDGAGNVYLTGYSYNFDNSSNDFYMAKYDSSGGPQWSAPPFNSGGSNSDIPASIVVDNGYVYVTGISYSASTLYDILTLKYMDGASAKLMWSKTFNGAAGKSDMPVGVRAVADGNIYVAGWTDKTTPLDGGSHAATGGSTTTVVTGRAWALDQWIGYYVMITSGSNSGQSRQITGNTTDGTLSISGASPFANAIIAGVTYYIYDSEDYDFYAVKYDKGTLNRPTGLSAEPVTTTQIDIAWDDNSSDEAKFKIERKPGAGGVYAQLDIVNANTVLYTDNTVTAGTRYYYRVAACADAPCTVVSYYSDEASALPQSLTPVWPDWFYIYSNNESGAADIAKAIATGPDNNPVVTGSSNYNNNNYYYTAKIDRSLAPANDTGTASGGTTTTLVDSARGVSRTAWTENQWKGSYVRINNNGGANDNVTRRVLSNTTDTLTLSSAFPEAVAASDTYYVYVGGTATAGTTTTITDTAQSWTSNQWAGFYVKVAISGETYSRKILSNTATVLTIVAGDPFPEAVAVSAPYSIDNIIWKGAGLYGNMLGSNDIPVSVGTDNNNNVTVTGHGGSTNTNILTIKYSSSGYDGKYVEMQSDGADSFAGPNNQYDYAIATAVNRSTSNSPNVVAVTGHGLNCSGTVLGTSHGANDCQNNIYNEDIYMIRYPDCTDSQVLCSPSWSKVYNGAGNGNDKPSAVAFDNDGNIFVTGYTQTAVTVLTSGTATGGTETTLIKTDAVGWTNDLYKDKFVTFTSGNNLGQRRRILTNTSTTLTLDTALHYPVESGEVFEIKSDNYDFFTAKFNGTTGSIMTGWPKTYNGGGSGDDYARALAVDPDGNVWVAGTAMNAAGNTDICVIKYNGADGTVLKAAVCNNGPVSGDDEAVAIKVDKLDKSVVVLGTVLTATGDHDFLINKYSKDGNEFWGGGAKIIKRPDTDDYAAAMDMDAAGDFCVAGNTGTTASPDILAVKFDYNGEVLGSNLIDRGGVDTASAVAANDRGEMYAAGSSANNHGDYDFFVFRCSGNSVPVPSPFAAAAVAGTANNQGVSLTWSNATLPGAIFQVEREDSTGAPGTWDIIKDYSANYTATSLSDTGLLPNNLYCYRIEAKMGGVASLIKLQACVTTTVDPPSLTSPLTVVSSSQINVSWPNVTGNIAYKLERSTGGAYSQIGGGDFAQDTVSYSDTGLTPAGTLFYYKLSVRNRSGWSLAGAVSSATTVPAVPTGLNVYSPTTNSLSVSWTNMTGNTGYTLQRSTTAGCAGAADIATRGANIVTYLDNGGGGLASGLTYYYWVRTLGANGNSAYSACTSGNKPILITPGGVSSTSVLSTSQISVTWTDPNPGGVAGSVNETGFTIEYVPCTNNIPSSCTVGGANWGTAATTTAGADATNATVGSLTSGRTYKFRVKATLSGADSAYNTALNATTKMTGGTLTATVQNSSQIYLSWPSILGADNYDVWKSSNADPTDCSTGADMGLALSSSTASKTVDSLSAGTKYCFKIRQYNSADSVYTACQCGTTQITPVTMVSAKGISSSQIDVSWNSGAGATFYKIDRSTDNATWTTLGPFDAASGTLYSNTTGLSAGTLYYYRVKYTVNGTDYSAVSDVKSATTTPNAPAFAAAQTYATSTTQIQVSWTGAAGANGYCVQFKLKQSQADNNCAAESDWPAADTCDSLTGLNKTYTSVTGTRYCMQVRSYITDTPNRNSSYNTPVEVTALLDAPGNLTLYNVTNNQIELSWNAVANENGYRIDRNIGGGSYTTIVPNNAGTTYPNTGLTAGTAYCYVVRTRNADGVAGPATSALCKTTTPAAPPSFNTAETKALSTTSIQVSWNAASGASGYCVQAKLKQAQGTNDCSGETDWPAEATCDDNGASKNRTYSSGVSEGTRYCVRVRAYVDTPRRYSAYSNTPKEVAALLAAPTGFNTSSIAVASIGLTWTNNAAGAGNGGYYIERKTGTGGTYGNLFSPVANAVTYTDSTVASGTQYCYRIYSKNADGINSASATGDNDVCKYTTPAAPPSTLRLDVVSPSEIDLSWQVVYGATHYRLERRLSSEPDTSFAQIGSDIAVGYGTSYCGYYAYQPVGCSLIANFTFYQDTAVAGDTQYCYRVKAWNSDGGYSAASNTACGKTSSVNAPAITSVTALSSRQLQLSWTYTPLGGEILDGFEIESRTDVTDWATVATVDNATFSYTDSHGVQPAKKYYYRVRAFRTIINNDFNTDSVDSTIWSALSGLNGGVTNYSTAPSPPLLVMPAQASGTMGTSQVTVTGGKVRMTSVTNATGTAAQYNYSQVYMINPNAFGGDFEMQVDYNLPNEQITPAPTLWHAYGRFRIDLPNSPGGINFASIERMVLSGTNYYESRIRADGTPVRLIRYALTGTENSGKMKITRNGNTLSAYIWVGNAWYLVNGLSNITLSSAPTGVYFIQYAQQTDNRTLVTDFDNFKVIEKSPFSAPMSDTTPAWLEGDDTCN